MRVVFRVTIMVVILWYCVAGVIPAFGSALRCGVRLITEGDTKLKVLAECGEPQYIDTWEEERIYRYDPGYGYDYYQHDDDAHRKQHFIKENVLVEEWTYNHGPHRFMDHVRFENGRVRKIISGEYGY